VLTNARDRNQILRNDTARHGQARDAKQRFKRAESLRRARGEKNARRNVNRLIARDRVTLRGVRGHGVVTGGRVDGSNRAIPSESNSNRRTYMCRPSHMRATARNEGVRGDTRPFTLLICGSEVRVLPGAPRICRSDGTVALGANRTILHRRDAAIRCANRSGRPISVGANRPFRPLSQTGRRRAASMQQCRCSARRCASRSSVGVVFAENEHSVNQPATRSTRTVHFDLVAGLFVGRSCARVSVSRDFGGAVLSVARRVSPRCLADEEGAW
jgi:hypothetical protein